MAWAAWTGTTKVTLYVAGVDPYHKGVYCNPGYSPVTAQALVNSIWTQGMIVIDSNNKLTATGTARPPFPIEPGWRKPLRIVG